MVPWQDGTRYALTYNGISPGPTLRARPGDVINVTLRNELDEPTNLHTHGLHVSPEGTSDNVFIMIEPGQEFSYRYEIPSDHPSGTFWYHPHHHGNSGTASRSIFGFPFLTDEHENNLLSNLFPDFYRRALHRGLCNHHSMDDSIRF